MVISRKNPLRGSLKVPADKSISHRTVILGGLAEGKSRVSNFLQSADTLSSAGCMQRLGIRIEEQEGELLIEGQGLHGLREPSEVLDCGNSGTTMRLLCGVLAGQRFFSVLTGDDSLCRRPMERVIQPLSRMGARIDGRGGGRFAPLAIRGGGLSGIEYRLPMASAQVKSALLLAGLYSEGVVELTEPQASRDHTERMLQAMGANLTIEGGKIMLKPVDRLEPLEINVPGDISSAAFFMIAATIVPGSELLLTRVGINPTRCGIIRVLREMGAKIQVLNERLEGGEPVGDIFLTSAPLKGVNITEELIPSLIDELPVLAVAMAMAEGDSRVSGASELRVKETDRIKAVCTNLAALGVDIAETEDGFVVRGGRGISGGSVESFGDHRIAMAMGVAGLTSRGEVKLRGAEAVAISYPEFWNDLARAASR